MLLALLLQLIVFLCLLYFVVAQPIDQLLVHVRQLLLLFEMSVVDDAPTHFDIEYVRSLFFDRLYVAAQVLQIGGETLLPVTMRRAILVFVELKMSPEAFVH